jgi:hypothetical protein
MAYESNLMGDFWRGYRQRRLATGQSLSQNEMSGLLSPTLDMNRKMEDDAARREQQQSQFNQQMNLQKDAAANQRMAGMVGGVGQLAQLPLAYGAGKSLGWWGGGTGEAGGGYGTQNLINSVNPYRSMSTTTVSGPSNLMGGTAPATAQQAVGAAGTLGGAQAASVGVPMANAAPYAASAPLTYGSVAGEAGSGLGAAGGITAGSIAAPVGAGLLGGQLGSSLAMKYSPIGGDREKKIGGGIVGGAAGGAAAGTAVMPGPGTAVGGVIGGIIGGISSLF